MASLQNFQEGSFQIICFRGPTITPPPHPHRHGVIRWKGPLGTVVLRAIDVSRKGEDSSGGVCRNPCPGFPGSSSPTRRGHKNHAPFSSREMQQHMCSVSTRLRLRVKRVLLGPLSEVACVSHSHENSRLSKEEQMFSAAGVQNNLISVGNIHLSRCWPRASPADVWRSGLYVNSYLRIIPTVSPVEGELLPATGELVVLLR